MRVCDFIARWLKEKGITHCFGFQGGAVTPLIDAIDKEGIVFFQSHHEQAGGFAAEGYARITGKLGVAIATNGPGVTNFITSVANAYLDSSPCLFITGQVNTADMKTGTVRQNGFQEVDNVALAQPVTKYAHTVKDITEIKYHLDKAADIALSGRKGSVLLDFPLDILMSEMNITAQKEYRPEHKAKPSQAKPSQAAAIDKAVLGRVWDKLSSAKRPLVLIGAGVRLADAHHELNDFIVKSGLPTVTTLMGTDVWSETNVGFAGIYGQTYANLAVMSADVLLVLGSRLSKRQLGKEVSQYAPNAFMIQVDIDEHELPHVVAPDIQIHADLKDFLNQIIPAAMPIDCNDWKMRLHKWQEKYARNTHVNKEGLDPVSVVEKISEITPAAAIITTDVGQNQMWVAQGWKLKKGQRILTSGGLGCMGFSLPAAIGAQVAASRNPVIAFMGDGGLQMNIQELQTVARNKMPVKIVVFNNASLGMIQEMQHKYMGDRYVGSRQGYSCPNLEKIAMAYGLPYTQCKGDVAGLEKALLSPESAFVEIVLKQNPTRLLIRYDEAAIYKTEALND